MNGSTQNEHLESRLNILLSVKTKPPLNTRPGSNYLSLITTKLVISCLFVLLVYFTACAPQILTFSSSPGRICKGQPTMITWDIKGIALLLSHPYLPNTGPVETSGSRKFALNETTLFTIKAIRSNKERYAEQEVKVYTSGDQKEIAIETEPDFSGNLVAVEALEPEVWGDIDEIMRIDSITNNSDRQLIVKHDHKEVMLPENSSSDEMKGLKISGIWEIHANLKPAEVMGDPSHAPPDFLTISITLSCNV